MFNYIVQVQFAGRQYVFSASEQFPLSSALCKAADLSVAREHQRVYVYESDARGEFGTRKVFAVYVNGALEV